MPVHLVQHPLVHDALATLRDASTTPETFRHMAVRISLLLAAEATRDIPSHSVRVQTPIGPADGRRVTDGVVVVPVLRAGLGMLDAVLELIPTARVGHIGLQRDEMTAVASQVLLEAAARHERIVRPDDRPDAGNRRERGGCARPHSQGRRPRRSHDLHRRGTRGHRARRRTSPDVHIYTPVIDEGLNAHKYIVPGLGDFGDRLYGT